MGHGSHHGSGGSGGKKAAIKQAAQILGIDPQAIINTANILGAKPEDVAKTIIDAANQPQNVNPLTNQTFSAADYKDGRKQFSGFAEASKHFKNENPEANWVDSEHTTAQNKALSSYCAAGYSSINKGLANGVVDSRAEQLTEAFDKSVITAPISITRQSNAMFLTQGKSATITLEQAKALVGTTIGSKVFESSGADNHGVYVSASSVIYHTIIPKGAKGAGMYVANSPKSMGKSENEFIVNRDSLFRVNKVYQKGGKIIVERSWVGLAEHSK